MPQAIFKHSAVRTQHFPLPTGKATEIQKKSTILSFSPLFAFSLQYAVQS